jgi:uncharacterized protein (TIRG00374 family)
MRRLKTALMTLLGLAVGAVLLAYAVKGVQAQDVMRLLTSADWLLAVPFLVLLFGFCAAKAARWALLLASVVTARARDVLPIVVVGYAGTVLLPLQLGELVRAAAAQRRFQASMTAVLASVAVERTFDLLAAAVLLMLALATNPAIDPRVQLVAWILPASVAVLFALLYIYARQPERLAAALVAPLRGFMPRVAERLQGLLVRGSTGAQSLRSSRVFAAAVALSFLQLAFIYGCVWVAFAACDVAVHPSAVLTVMVLTTLGMSLPSAPGYVGSIQAAFVVGLAPYGIDSTQAVTASLYYHLLICGSLLLGGVAWLPSLRLSPDARRLTPDA